MVKGHLLWEHARTVKMQFDVIVVGAGVEGSATAYQLIKNGAKNVLLLEQVLKLYASYI